MRRVPLEPVLHTVVVELLRPEEASVTLTHDLPLVRGEFRREAGLVESIGFCLSSFEDRIEIGAVRSRFRARPLHIAGKRQTPAELHAFPWCRFEAAPGERVELCRRLTFAGDVERSRSEARPNGADFDAIFEARQAEADAFYEARFPAKLAPDERQVMRQGYAGLLWTKQFYHYSVKDWLEGDAAQPAPPPARSHGRNCLLYTSPSPRDFG